MSDPFVGCIIYAVSIKYFELKIEDRSQVIDKGFNIDVIYLDFSKAFDKVSHRLMLHKLQNYGIEGKVYKRIEEFRNILQQCVVINGTQSTHVPITSSVPQSSALGPILFLVYVNARILSTVSSKCLQLIPSCTQRYPQNRPKYAYRAVLVEYQTGPTHGSYSLMPSSHRDYTCTGIVTV